MAEEQDEQQQQNLLDAELVLINEQVKIATSNFRIAQEKTRPDVIYKFWYTITYELIAKAFFFTIGDKVFEVNADLLRNALSITPKDLDHPFTLPAPEKEIIKIHQSTWIKSKEEGVDHLKKLKGLETLSEAAQFQLNIKRARKASRHDFFIQQHPRGSGEGSSITLEVPDELVFKTSNKGAGVTLEVLNEPSDHFSSSSSESEFAAEDISSDEAGFIEKSDNEETADVPKNPEATLISSSQTLSSVEFTSQFLDDNLEITVNDVLKDPVEPEVQSLIDIPVESGELECRVNRLEKKVHAMSCFNLPEVIDKFVKAHLKNVFPKDVPDFGKIKMEKATKKSTPKAYERHPTHKALYDALSLSLSVDEDDMDLRMLRLIDDLLLERRVMRSLECYVGGTLNDTDYRL
ncbi:hypothetical protein Tco_0138856 [Tanacetum coccineum]